MSATSSPDAARVVVVGGGFAGMAAAARLAKRGHRVTLLEAVTSSAAAFDRCATPVSCGIGAPRR
jgi:2-polyprenyl-6-methoxyphenol hydroxylase-like FAD-dependent oxidoreductase